MGKFVVKSLERPTERVALGTLLHRLPRPIHPKTSPCKPARGGPTIYVVFVPPVEGSSIVGPPLAGGLRWGGLRWGGLGAGGPLYVRVARCMCGWPAGGWPGCGWPAVCAGGLLAAGLRRGCGWPDRGWPATGVRVACGRLVCDGRAGGPLYVRVACSRLACASGVMDWPTNSDSLTSLHHRNLLLRQPVQLVHDLVDQRIAGGNGGVEGGEGGLALLEDAHEAGQAVIARQTFA